MKMHEGFVGAAMPAQDTVKGAKDHPLLSRFDGAKLVGYDTKAYTDVKLVMGQVVDNGARAPEKWLPLEGRHTQLAYNYSPQRGSLEVMRNYEAALKQAGMTVLYACAKDTCGREFGSMMVERVGTAIFPDVAYTSPFNYGRQSERYVLAQGKRPDGSSVYAAVYVVDPVGQQNGGIYIELVESEKLESGKVTANLSAETMAKGIATDGKVAVYGVYFDTGKWDVKPQSAPALDEMAKLLKNQPALKVYIVGHTDSQGNLAGNLDLSQRRAEAVVKALEAQYKVDPKRLFAKGVASLAPVASNDGDAGREKNRRVELVKQ
jgi:outer membrane protein OmpA-like peptidoglycan-associated protein